ncbi:MAG: hypothetical protein KGJ60_11400 [Verrucomicrobiota bacterium]|nr:hypothetical protein [Verrucomicrobiota bacterium]
MGRAKIHDEFTDLPVSRQRKCQLRRQKEGRCIICGKPLCSAQFCLEHMIAARERLRKRTGAVSRNRGSRSYRLAALAKKKRRR